MQKCKRILFKTINTDLLKEKPIYLLIYSVYFLWRSHITNTHVLLAWVKVHCKINQ